MPGHKIWRWKEKLLNNLVSLTRSAMARVVHVTFLKVSVGAIASCCHHSDIYNAK